MTLGYSRHARRLSELQEDLKTIGDFIAPRLTGLAPTDYESLLSAAGEEVPQ